ncbi:hypothetical protein ACFFK0_04780 [Paenibacillus chartarius]|uniref:Uncharacterized protein n=1 Tax=Paenibacillus chartarius TaxID=747481 RepID=A0ABV6DGJ9_9BACL
MNDRLYDLNDILHMTRSKIDATNRRIQMTLGYLPKPLLIELLDRPNLREDWVQLQNKYMPNKQRLPISDFP